MTRRIVLLALALALMFLLPASLAVASERAVKNARVAIDSSPSFDDLARTGHRHGIVILQAWRLDELRAIKAANPEVKVLVYKNLSFATQGTGPFGLSSSGVSYGEAEENPEWFLKNTSGERFTSRGYGFLWAMDVGSPSYQERWASNVVAEVERNGWDGVFLDDTNPTMKYHYDVSRVAEYPSDAAYTAATTSALAHIGPRIRAAGKLAISNNAQWVEYYDVGVSWLRYLDGMMDEMFLKWSRAAGEGYRGEYQWNIQLNEIKAAEREGKMFVGITQSANDDHKAARFGYATALLAGQGRTHFAMHGDYSNENWFPEYDLDIGTPTEPERADAAGVHRRPFTRGLVLVNPTSETKTVSLGATYSGSGLTRVSRVTMEPSSGLVLMREGDTGSGTPSRGSPRRGSLLATVNSGRDVALTWSSAGLRGVQYRVFRGRERLRTTLARRFVDRDAPATSHTYRVLAVNQRGETVRSSAVGVAVPRRGVLSRREVRGYLSSPNLAAWREVFVQRRVARSQRWRRVSQTVPARARVAFRLSLRPRATIRLVARRRVNALASPSGALKTPGLTLGD